MELLELIKESNLFNFAIFLVILIIIAKRVDIPALLENMKADIIKNINASKSAKQDSENELQNAQKSFDNVGSEIEEIQKATEKNAENLKTHMIEDANTKANSMRENAEKIVKIEEKNLNNLLLTKHSKKSLEIAKEHITHTLKGNNDLQRKFVEYSLDELEGLWK